MHVVAIFAISYRAEGSRLKILQRAFLAGPAIQETKFSMPLEQSLETMPLSSALSQLYLSVTPLSYYTYPMCGSALTDTNTDN